MKMKLPFGMVIMKLTKVMEDGTLDRLKILHNPQSLCMPKATNLVQIMFSFGHILEEIINGFKPQMMKLKYLN